MSLILVFTGCTQDDPINTEYIDKAEQDSDSTLVQGNVGTESGSEGIMRAVDLTNRSRLTIDLSSFVEVENSLKVKEVVVGLERLEAVTSYLIVDKMLYYLTSYSGYYDNFLQIGEALPEYDKNHTAKLCSYNLETDEKTVLHEYLSEYVVNVTDLTYEDGYLIWMDFLYQDGTYEWSGRHFNLAENAISEPLGPSKGNDSIVLTPANEISNVSSNTAIKYEHGKRWTQIIVEHEDQIAQMGVKGLVDSVDSNGEICIWRYPESEDNLHVYDIKNDQYYAMGMGYITMTNVCVYKQWLIMDTAEGLYAYDIPKKQYLKLGNVDTGYFYVYADYIHTEVTDDGDFTFTILLIQ